MNTKNVFVCVVFHHSDDIRPNGSDVIMEFCDSWRKSKLPYTLVVLDNESDISYAEHLKGIPHHYMRVDNQVENGGLTGAWNQLAKFAYENGADIITGFNDDIQFNDTFHKYVESITDDNTVYAPLTNGIAGGPWQWQKSNGVKHGYRYESNIVNGFWFGFTSKFYEDKSENGVLFDVKITSDMDDWAGQEFMFPYWSKKYNTRCLTIGDCWLHHTKLRAWKVARNTHKK